MRELNIQILAGRMHDGKPLIIVLSEGSGVIVQDRAALLKHLDTITTLFTEKAHNGIHKSLESPGPGYGGGNLLHSLKEDPAR